MKRFWLTLDISAWWRPHRGAWGAVANFRHLKSHSYAIGPLLIRFDDSEQPYYRLLTGIRRHLSLKAGWRILIGDVNNLTLNLIWPPLARIEVMKMWHYNRMIWRMYESLALDFSIHRNRVVVRLQDKILRPPDELVSHWRLPMSVMRVTLCDTITPHDKNWRQEFLQLICIVSENHFAIVEFPFGQEYPWAWNFYRDLLGASSDGKVTWVSKKLCHFQTGSWICFSSL